MSITSIRLISVILSTLFGIAISQPGIANQLSDMPLDKKVASSDLVIIGRAISEGYDKGNEAFSVSFVVIETVSVLKGSPPRRIEMVTKGLIAEQNINCCPAGTLHLFFLKKSRGSRYLSVNGRYGVYPM